MGFAARPGAPQPPAFKGPAIAAARVDLGLREGLVLTPPVLLAALAALWLVL